MGKRFSRVLDIVRSVRGIVLPHWGKAEIVEYKTERYESPVTQYDRDVERHIAEALKAEDPSIGFVGEESGGDRTKERFWLLDPIDGTTAFVQGLPYCTTMLALIENGRPTFSVIYDFINNILYHAELGKGAYKDTLPIHVNSHGPSNATIGLESQRSKEQAIIKRLEDQFRIFKTMTAGYEFVQVATGKIEGRICLEPYGIDYDFAPGTLLVSEAGGVVANIGTDTYDYKNLDFIAANRQVFDFLTTGSSPVFPIRVS